MKSNLCQCITVSVSVMKMDKYLKLSSSDTPKPSKIRKYDTNYIELGFIKGNGGKPMCVICLQLLANEAMKLAKLKRHLLTKHLEYSNKPKDFFIRKGEEYFHQRTRLTNVDQLSARRHIPFVMIVAVIATIWNIGGLWWPKTLLRSFICVHMCLCFLCVPSPALHFVIATSPN